MTNKLLHVGSGLLTKEKTTQVFNTDDWEETRLDINEDVNPDIIASLTDMSEVESNSYDAVFSHHNIEHLYAYQVPLALNEMSRVLKDDGYLIISCPDLHSVCEKVTEGKVLEPLYQSGLGPITAIDILFGLRSDLSKGNHYMAHNCGFTKDVLYSTLKNTGFKSCLVAQWKPSYVLWGIAYKNLDKTQEELIIELKDHTAHTPLKFN